MSVQALFQIENVNSPWERGGGITREGGGFVYSFHCASFEKTTISMALLFIYNLYYNSLFHRFLCQWINCIMCSKLG